MFVTSFTLRNAKNNTKKFYFLYYTIMIIRSTISVMKDFCLWKYHMSINNGT